MNINIYIFLSLGDIYTEGKKLCRGNEGNAIYTIRKQVSQYIRFPIYPICSLNPFLHQDESRLGPLSYGAFFWGPYINSALFGLLYPPKSKCLLSTSFDIVVLQLKVVTLLSGLCIILTTLSGV